MSISPFWSALTAVWMSGMRDPLDAVELDDLAAGQARGGLAARLVLRVLDVDRSSRPASIRRRLKMNGPEPITSSTLICVLGSVSATRFGHHEGHVRRRLAERLQHQAVRLLQLQREGLGVRRPSMSPTRAHQLLAHRILGAPALDRGDAVLGGDRLAVMPFEAVAQGEGLGELVGRDVVLVDHLRLDLELLVHREQRVPDEVAVIALTM